MFPSEAVVHTRDLIDAVDSMVVSWAPADNIVATHWRDPPSLHAAPVDDLPTPPNCTPGYVRQTLTVKEGPTLVAVNSGGDVFFAAEGKDFLHQKIYRIPAASIEASTMHAEVYSTDDMDIVDGLALDAQGRMYASQGRGSIVRTDPREGIAPRFLSFAEKLTGNAYHLKFNAHGDIIYIDFQRGNVMKRTSSHAVGDRDSRDILGKGDTGENRETRIASGFDRPAGLAADPSNAVYVVDEARRLIERVAPDGTVQIIPVQLRHPEGIALDAEGNLFVIENALAPVQRISPAGKACAVTHEVRSAYSDIAVDGHGRVFATNLLDHVIDEFVPIENALSRR
jgi:DNA-binding beta-propeller fold protein YncE